jgi:hypothetical protein
VSGLSPKRVNSIQRISASLTRLGKLRPVWQNYFVRRPLFGTECAESLNNDRKTSDRFWSFARGHAFYFPPKRESFCAVAALLVSPDMSKVSLTHTVFHGSNFRCSPVPFSPGDPDNSLSTRGRRDQVPLPWKCHIVAPVFWVGEQAAEGNPIPNTESAWDASWVVHYGGEDSPIQRANFIATGFTPRQNPFYVALPYNDVEDQHTRPEAAQVIPWFRDSFVRDGQSVCKDHWVAIRHGTRTCYAQWEDVGPFQIDHWQYVFGSERPRPNRN